MTRRISIRVRVRRRWVIEPDGVMHTACWTMGGMKDARKLTEAIRTQDRDRLERSPRYGGLGARWWDQTQQRWRRRWPSWMWRRGPR